MGLKFSASDSLYSKVLVLGGGLAGLSAACHLLDQGYRVTLVEKRPFLGGRAYSFNDQEFGCEVDNGQHVFMGCCTYYIDFLKKVSAFGKASLQKKLKVKVVSRAKSGTLSSIPLLGPLHLLPSLLAYPHLRAADKARVLYALLCIKYTNRSSRHAELSNKSFYQWLKVHRQTEQAISRLWNLIILPTLNDDVRAVSADMGLMVFQEALLGAPFRATLGYSRVGLTALAGDSAHGYITSHGGEVITSKAVAALRIEDGLVKGVQLSTGEVFQADACISALPFDVLFQVLPPDVSEDPFFEHLRHFSSSPIVGIHIWYDRPVTDEEFVAFLDSPVQWVFNKSLIQGLNGYPGQYLCISLSGAWDYVHMPKEKLKEVFIQEMASLFPRAREATVQRFLVVKQPQATFRSLPGAADHRLPQATPIANLFLAGEWTDTGWPSTMEGAVRSGVFAARALASRS